MDFFKKMLVGGKKGKIEFVGGASVSDSSSGSYNISLTSLSGGTNTSPSEDDIVIVYSVEASDAGGDIISSGWTEIYHGVAIDSSETSFYAHYKIMGETPDTSITIDGDTEGAAGAVAVMVFSGVDTTTPMDVTYQGHTEINTVLVDPDSITPITGNAIIIAGGGGGHSDGSKLFSSSELSNFISDGKGGLTADSTIGIGSCEWEGGAFDPAQFTFTGSDHTTYSNVACTVALRPA